MPTRVIEVTAPAVSEILMDEEGPSISLKACVFHILMDTSVPFRKRKRGVIKALEALHLYDQTVVAELNEYLVSFCHPMNIRSDTLAGATSEVAMVAIEVIEICCARDEGEAYKFNTNVASTPQWLWTFPQHYAPQA